ncbi:MAG TPA: bifunctional hydroxymethylpyrimidine kinase/phosphomethylpyrimidine kinase [Burkholderiaceae bacterium]|nr:bifunctional hydroxymethylpyrimidine kinase/phosphomethylpyrimidine kinase [Burkholderiaceae bacterium]
MSAVPASPTTAPPGRPIVLLFSQFDPTGATGALADALTCASMGCHAVSALTLLAVQDSARLGSLQPCDGESIEDQARGLLQDMPVAAIKVGAIVSADQVQAIAEILADYPDLPVVFDPWMPADLNGAGEAEWLVAARELLLPQTSVLMVTPTQAHRLLTAGGDDEDAPVPSPAECARRLLGLGAQHVLIAGAEVWSERFVNRLYNEDGTVQNESIDRVGLPFRGAGETLSAAIAALLAQNLAIDDAVREANDYLGQALAAGFRAGMGDAMPDRMFWAVEEDDGEDAGEDADEGDAESDENDPER